jgi:hypothetical protein
VWRVYCRGMSGMEMRDGVWTSQTRARDASDIERLALDALARTSDPEIHDALKRIVDLAGRLRREL